jgi:hypothetical protein
MRGLKDSFGNKNWDAQCGIGTMASGERMSGPDLDGCTSDAFARYTPKFGGVAPTPVWKAEFRNLNVYDGGSNSTAAPDDETTSKLAPALFSRVMAPKPCHRGGNAQRPVSNRSKHAGPDRHTPSQFMGVGPAWRHRMAFRTADAAPTDEFSRVRGVE